MIVRYQKAMINPIMNIWFEENLRSHFFIPTSFWTENFDDVKKEIGKSEVWVYTEKNEILGFIGIIGDCYIAGLFVKRNFQNKGIGRKLIEHIKSRFSDIKLKVFIENRHAVQFYRRNGFKVINSIVTDGVNEELEMNWKKSDPIPDFRWLEEWNRKRLELKAPFNVNQYFEKAVINYQWIEYKYGDYISMPTGDIIVNDPFSKENIMQEKPFFHKVSNGLYNTSACCIATDESLIASVKVTLGDSKAIDFENAMRGTETLSLLKTQDYFGTYSESGFLAVCDARAWADFKGFKSSWQRDNPKKNIFLDFFKPLFNENQRFINFNIPDSIERIFIFESGYGEGSYPAYFGYDQNGVIINLVIQLIDIEQAYEKEETL